MTGLIINKEMGRRLGDGEKWLRGERHLPAYPQLHGGARLRLFGQMFQPDDGVDEGHLHPGEHCKVDRLPSRQRQRTTRKRGNAIFIAQNFCLNGHIFVNTRQNCTKFLRA